LVVSVVLQILSNKKDKEDPVIRETVTDFFAAILDKA